MKIILVAGARPNFMKIAPLMEAFGKRDDVQTILVHTGQHYDEKMSDLFFRELGIPEPDVNLGVGSATHAVQTAEIMRAFEPIVVNEKPDLVLVVGDVNSTIACGLVAVKLGVKLAHVEAGLRSGDREMPEEINRILTDSISDMLFCTEPSGIENLKREGVPDERVFLVGNVMIDTLHKNRSKAEASQVLERLDLKSGSYALLTLHRPSNVDDPEVLSSLLGVLDTIQRDVPILFPMHPRTRNRIQQFGLADRVEQMTGLRCIEPVGYLDFLKLMANARLMLTDSGGIQEETTILNVPCLTLRENTERPITCTAGTNVIVGVDPDAILAATQRVLGVDAPTDIEIPLWDGQASERIVALILDRLRTD